MNIQNRLRRRLGAQCLGLVLSLSGSLVGALALSAAAQANQALPAINQVVQIDAVQITDVRVEVTDAGLQVVLETADGTLAEPTTSVSGDALILEISNAVLVGDGFEEFAPAEGIALVQVSALSNDRVQVVITGSDAVPRANVGTDAAGLTLSVVPGIIQAGETSEPLRIVVTGEEDEGYNPSSASVGTRIDTPLRDIPRSIQVIPRQIIEDQQADNLNEALENVPGVVPATSQRSPFVVPVIRGFGGFTGGTDLIRRNGLRDPSGISSAGETENIERVEVIRGPASVLYGQGSSGGRINVVTKQPLDEPFYEVSSFIGNFDTYRGTADLSGPLNDSGTVRYRLNLAAGTEGSFIDFYDRDRYLISPVVTWDISENTRLTLDTEISRYEQNGNDFGIPARGTILDNPIGQLPNSLYIGDPDAERKDATIYRAGLSLEHNFSENWSIRSAFSTVARLAEELNIFDSGLDDDNRTLNRSYFDATEGTNVYGNTLDTYVTGVFNTGNIQHQLVTGVELLQQEDTTNNGIFGNTDPIDIFNPSYGNLVFTPIDTFDTSNRTEGLGLYIQNQISLLDNLILVLGGRYDILSAKNEDFINSTSSFQQNEAFSPQVGIVYSPIEPISLYASYSRSFFQSVGRTFDNSIFKPQRGTQYEIGLKADINERLSTTLALYDLTRSNIVTEDPNNPSFNIQTGEQNSQGVELNVAGEILPGWNIAAGYAYNDARITEDNTFEEGNCLNNAPENAFSFWSTYRIQEGNLSGLGVGLGLFYVGDRQGDLANTFTVPDYLRTDAAVFYERDQFRAAINVRNLFDIDYFVAAENDLRVFPGDPLSVSASLSWKF